MEIIEFKTIEEKNKFLTDPIIKELENQINKVFNLSLPEDIFIKKSGELIVKYNKTVQEKVNKIVKLRNEYILFNYQQGPNDDSELH